MEGLYRTEVPKGWFRQLGSLHLHIDGSGSGDGLQQIISEFEQSGAAVKFTHIIKAVGGPQRLDCPETYQIHTPGSQGSEEFNYFSTIRFANYGAMLQSLRLLFPRLNQKPGIVVEAEEVVGVISKKGKWSGTMKPQVPVLDPTEVGFQCSRTEPIEIHHAFDIPKHAFTDQATPPVDLEVLTRDCTDLNIRLGGWFLFEKKTEWSYRSNMFAELDASLELIIEQRARLDTYLRKYTFCSPVWTIVEYVLGVWKTPLLATPNQRTL